jgi:hypothetical protein
MRFSSFFAFTALSLTLFAPSAATAESITYNIVDYSALGIQNNSLGQPVTFSGTIVTDGTTGTNITDPKFIQSWSFTFTQGADTRTVSSDAPTAHVSIGGFGVDVSESTIRLFFAGGPASIDFLTDSPVNSFTGWSTMAYGSGADSGPTTTMWSHLTTEFGPPNHAAIAQVPEPARLALLGIGIAGMAGYAWRRRRILARS